MKKQIAVLDKVVSKFMTKCQIPACFQGYALFSGFHLSQIMCNVEKERMASIESNRDSCGVIKDIDTVSRNVLKNVDKGIDEKKERLKIIFQQMYLSCGGLGQEKFYSGNFPVERKLAPRNKFTEGCGIAFSKRAHLR